MGSAITLYTVPCTEYNTAMAEERVPYDSPTWDADRISALRLRLGLTQAAFARQLGIRQQTVSEWETGRYLPRGASLTILRLAEERTPYDAGHGSNEAAP